MLHMFLLLVLFQILSLSTFVRSVVIDSKVHLFGRYETYADGNIAWQWPGSGFKFRAVSKTGGFDVRLEFANCTDSCTFIIETHIDCQSNMTYEVSNSTSSIKFRVNSRPEEIIDVVVFKRNEAQLGRGQGQMILEQIILENADIIEQPNQHYLQQASCFNTRRKLLFIGDSITAGYGVEGTSPCEFSIETENAIKSYAALTAKYLQSDFHLLAWSGKGVVRNYGDTVFGVDTIPVLYNRTIATDPTSFWSPVLYMPDVVVVMLGTNDYSTNPIPTDDQFIGGFVSFWNQIKSDYPSAKYLTACAPMRNGIQCSNTEKVAQLAEVEYLSVGEEVFSGGYGCGYHPNVATQENMAALVVPKVASLLGLK